MEQSKFAKEFYKKLSVEGLAERVTKERTKVTIKKILPYLKKSDKILDLACGYGRITIPLYKRGFDIRGVDISSNMIKEAKKRNKKIEFKVGDMKRIPYANESFDKVICLWTAFNELISKKDQLKCLNEIYRVLKQEGLAIIDMPNPDVKWVKDKVSGNKRVMELTLNNLKIKHYIHNKKTLNKLGKLSKFKRYKAEIKNFGIRRRLILFLRKA